MADKLAPTERNPAKVAASVNAALDGRLLNIGSVTLTAGSTSTTILDSRLGPDRYCLLIPCSSAAATLGWWQESASKGSAVMRHSAPAADLTVHYFILGG